MEVKQESSKSGPGSNNGDANDSIEPPSKKFRATEDVDIRLLISRKEAGAIIGKGGVNINHLRKTYKSSVIIPDCPGPERVLTIVISLNTLNEFMMDMIGYLDDKNNEKEVELRLLIHTSIAGGIIGKAGKKIRELREQTKAAIKLYSQCCPNSTERICAITGGTTVVANAVKVILDIIMSTPLKGVVKLYDPRMTDPLATNAIEYGGIVDPTYTNSVYRNLTRLSNGGPNPLTLTRTPLAGEHWDGRSALHLPMADLRAAPADPKAWLQAAQAYQYAPHHTAQMGPDVTGAPIPTTTDLFHRWVTPVKF
ncbi:heterogeneous nuclear ribonucleoprotein K-like [Panonychus citri]|uniref:heterogeneous nuclear ribonucleoprotein K-like n=1 Tax=Panonychus citri TaxID=50023 RepID=UPI0023073D10|nr:heterogeneous nuclear ribonucleoprotein K-like [Panonychus citri]